MSEYVETIMTALEFCTTTESELDAYRESAIAELKEKIQNGTVRIEIWEKK